MELSVRLVCSVWEDLLCFVIHLSIRCCECLDVNKTMGEHVSICLVNRTDHLLYVCLFQLFIISGYVYSTSVTGEKLWLDRGSNPGPFADPANTLPLSYRVTRSYHQQKSTWKLPRLHFYVVNYCISVLTAVDLSLFVCFVWCLFDIQVNLL